MKLPEKFLLSLFFCSFLLLPFYKGFAKSYSLERVQVHAVVQPDGSIDITESRTYNFRGRFSWADYRLPVSGFGGVENFTLADNFGNYIPENNEEPGSYLVEYSDSEFYVRWFYSAENESRTFHLRYSLTDVISVFSDVAELYFKFVGRQNNQSIGNVSVLIQLPEPAGFPEVRAWAHGPLWGNISIANGQVVMNVSPLPARRFWEARVVFPASWVPDSRRVTRENRLEYILEEEKVWADQANREREEARKNQLKSEENRSRAWAVSIFLTVAGLLGLIFLYFRYGRGSDIAYHEQVTSELPTGEPPAITSAFFFNKQVYGTAITATIFDLARRGYLHIEQTTLPVKKWWGTVPAEIALRRAEPEQGDKGLLDYEINLLDFIFQELGKGTEQVSLKLFKKNRSRVQKWFNKWKDLVKEHIRDVPYYEKSSIRGTVYAVILSVIVMGGGFIALYLLGKPGILAIIAGVVMIGLSFSILSYTAEIKLKRKKLSALKNYLKKYYFLDRTEIQQQSPNIDSFLIYGIVLGLGKKEIEKLMLTISPEEQGTYFPWYHYPAGGFTSPAEFASAVSSMTQVAASTVSSSTGAGGGASGGGGGGGGGAGGGAG